MAAMAADIIDLLSSKPPAAAPRVSLGDTDMSEEEVQVVGVVPPGNLPSPKPTLLRPHPRAPCHICGEECAHMSYFYLG